MCSTDIYTSIHGGVVECYTHGWKLTGDTALCPIARHFILNLVLVQPWNTVNHPDIIGKLLTGT